MARPSDPAGAGEAVPALPVPEIRDYARINAELARLLDAGHRRVRLAGVERQRLLVSGLAGTWSALVEVDGPAGPELAAGLDAPNLIVVARRSADDGAGRALRSGRLVILGDAGDGVGATMCGGAIIVGGTAGHRAGLNQAGGTLILLGGAGRLAGDRQSGGLLAAFGASLGPHAGRGQRGGRRLQPGDSLEPADLAALDDALRGLGEWSGPPCLLGSTFRFDV